MERGPEKAVLKNGKEEESVTVEPVAVEDKASSPSLMSVERVSSRKTSIPFVPKLFKRAPPPSSGAKQQQHLESAMQEPTQESEKNRRRRWEAPFLKGVPPSSSSDANQRQAMPAQCGKADAAEASSSTWMQMAQEVTDLESAMLELDEPVVIGMGSLPVEELPSPPVAAGSSSWMEEMTRILKGTTLTRREEKAMWTKSCIYRVPEWVKRNNSRAYRPEVVSLGPFHHGHPKLLPMEEHKRRLMLHMVKRSGKPLEEFVDAVAEVAAKLQDAYDGIDKKWLGEENTRRFVEMMVTDGGFLLEIMTVTRIGMRDYDVDHDPIFSIQGILDLKRRIRSDMCLVENQLPLLVLQKLEAVRRGAPPMDEEINNWVTRFLRRKSVQGNRNLGLHPLDVFHKSFCLDDSSTKNLESEKTENTMRSAVELREAGVNFKISKTQSIQDIDFKNGVLRMPLVEVDDTTEKIFLNLMAFEKLHRNAGTHATDYMIFMDNIIDSERDLALLREKGVIKNFLSSDKAAARLFNTLRKGAKLNPSSELGHVQWKVADHCRKPWHKWRAIFRHTYMSNPWVFISLVAAGILLAVTILQTAYTIVPFYTEG
ncbi:hypothetical protein ACP70R_008352 [Stipagrostis hirtigluma subsp. patula]